MRENQFASAAFESPQLESAIAQCCLSVNQQLWSQSADGVTDLVVAFVAGYTGSEFESAVPRICELTRGKTVLAVTCQSLVWQSKELERVQGVSLWAARLPSASITPMVLEMIQGEGVAEMEGLPGDRWEDDAVLMMLSEAYSFPADVLLAKINQDHPGVRVFGGVADGGFQPQEARLMINGETFASGAVAVRISGVKIKTIVSQGCRPIGETYVVTQAERNEVQTLGGIPAMEVLKRVYATLPTQDRLRVETGLHLGIAMTELMDRLEYGDFLIRNVFGIDQGSGSITIGDFIRKGRTVQFHIRDQSAASAELESMLRSMLKSSRAQALQTKPSSAPSAAPSSELSAAPSAALMFTCNGRGSQLFDVPDHDAALLQKVLGDLTVAGFFAAGEFGSVGHANFLHGFTASIALFE